jgi:hypothetical protein
MNGEYDDIEEECYKVVVLKMSDETESTTVQKKNVTK